MATMINLEDMSVKELEELYREYIDNIDMKIQIQKELDKRN